MVARICRAVTTPSPVVLCSEKITCPDCSPPRVYPWRSISSRTYRSPHRRAHQTDPRLPQRHLEADVAHYRCHHGPCRQTSRGGKIESAQGQDLIAVHQGSGLVHRKHPISVPVVREPHLGPLRDHHPLKVFRVERPAPGVDVETIRRHVERDDLRPQLLQHRRRNPVRRTVRAIHRHLHAPQRDSFRKGVLRKLDVPARRISDAVGFSDVVGWWPDRSRAPDRIISSISASRASGNFNPSPEKNLMPLSSKELCDAEMTTPASARRLRVMNAMPGVGGADQDHVHPMEVIPAVRAVSSI